MSQNNLHPSLFPYDAPSNTYDLISIHLNCLLEEDES